MSLQYVMTLSGPKIAKKPVSLLGVFDPITQHPIAAIVGVAVGIFCGLRAGKRRR